LAESSTYNYIAAIYRLFEFDVHETNSRVKLTLWAIKHGLVKIEVKKEEPVYIEKPNHTYQVLDKVRVTNHAYNGAEGVIVDLMPWNLVAPAYYVGINGVIVAVSERSLERIETNGNTKA